MLLCAAGLCESYDRFDVGMISSRTEMTNPLYTQEREIKSVNRGRTFKRDLIDEREIRTGIGVLADEVARALRATERVYAAGMPSHPPAAGAPPKGEPRYKERRGPFQ